jgi:integrase/recombinase XerD
MAGQPGNNGRRARGTEFGKRWQELTRSTDPRSLRTFAWRYLEAMRMQNYSERTVIARCQDLARFAQWCEERELQYPGDVTKPILERFQRHLFYYRKADGRPLAVVRQVGFIQSLQAFFRWLVRDNHVPSNPASDLVLPRCPARRLREPLSLEEVERVLALLDPADPVQLRDRAMLEVLYSTGLRRFELLRLTVYDLDARYGTVFVRLGKGQKDRLIPVGERAIAWVNKYLNDVRAQWVSDPGELHLFLNPDGTVPSDNTLTVRTRALFRRAGIAKAGACHLFRHTMATQMLEHGADVRYVQEMLGHASLNTTQVYTHVSIGRLKAVHAATHPGAKLARREHDDGNECVP